MKGAFNVNPPKPKHTFTWDIRVLLDHFKNCQNADMALKQLTIKTVSLLAIYSAQRCQTLSLLEIDNVKFTSNHVSIKVDHTIKQSRPGYTNPTLRFEEYVDKDICIVSCLKEYINRTNQLRESKWLLISYAKPHRGVSSATISRWIKTALGEAGIDTETFGAHSVRGASISAAFNANMNIDDILKAGGWSNASTVATFYKRPVLDNAECYNTKLLQ